MIEIKIDQEDGSQEIRQLPSKKVVCPRCQGEGVHDCWEGGMTGDEMAEQGPEFFEDYMAGVYSTKCTVCNGLRVVDVVDRERTSAKLLKAYDEAKELSDYFAHAERMGY